jgi:hypothetical protein
MILNGLLEFYCRVRGRPIALHQGAALKKAVTYDSFGNLKALPDQHHRAGYERDLFTCTIRARFLARPC